MAPTLTSPNVDNYTVGKGIVSIKGAADAVYVDIGNVPEFELTPNVTKLDHFSSRAGIRSKDKSVVTEKSATLRMIMEEFTARNLELALLGRRNETDPSAVTVDILSESSVTVAVKFVGTNDVGPKWSYEFPQVEFSPSSSFNPISDEWGQLEVTGEVLWQEADQRFGVATADFSNS
jgi:hypothetical protein